MISKDIRGIGHNDFEMMQIKGGNRRSRINDQNTSGRISFCRQP
jgi:hypothetical protein